MIRSITVPASLLNFGDIWRGPAGATDGEESLTGIANSFRPTDLDLTLTNIVSGLPRTVTVNRAQWIAVLRDM